MFEITAHLSQAARRQRPVDGLIVALGSQGMRFVCVCCLALRRRWLPFPLSERRQAVPSLCSLRASARFLVPRRPWCAVYEWNECLKEAGVHAATAERQTVHCHSVQQPPQAAAVPAKICA